MECVCIPCCSAPSCWLQPTEFHFPEPVGVGNATLLRGPLDIPDTGERKDRSTTGTYTASPKLLVGQHINIAMSNPKLQSAHHQHHDEQKLQSVIYNLYISNDGCSFDMYSGTAVYVQNSHECKRDSNQGDKSTKFQQARPWIEFTRQLGPFPSPRRNESLRTPWPACPSVERDGNPSSSLIPKAQPTYPSAQARQDLWRKEPVPRCVASKTGSGPVRSGPASARRH